MQLLRISVTYNYIKNILHVVTTCLMECSPAVYIFGVDTSSLAQHELQRSCLSMDSCEVEGSVRLGTFGTVKRGTKVEK